MTWEEVSMNLVLGLATNGLFDAVKQYAADWNGRPERLSADLKNMDLERSLMRSFLLAQIAVINATLDLPGLTFREKRVLKQWKPAFLAFASGLDQMEFPAPPIRKVEDLLRILQHRVRPSDDLERVKESLLLQAYNLFPDAPESYLKLLEGQLLSQFLHFFERELKEGKKVKQFLDVQLQSAQLYRQEEVLGHLRTLQESVAAMSERALDGYAVDPVSLRTIQNGVCAEVARESEALRTAMQEGQNRVESAVFALREQAQAEHGIIIQLLVDMAKRLDALTAAGPEAGPIKMAIPAVPRHFVGRNALLGRIHDTLVAMPGLKAVLLYGLGGMGKTALAATYVDRYGAEFSHRLWFDLEGDATLSLQAFLLQAGRYDPKMTTDDMRLAVRTWLSGNDGWVLVLNGATETARPANFLPADYRGTVIVTCRDRWLYGEAEAVAVHELDQPASVQYLLDATGHPNREGAERLARRLAGYPLMLEMAAAYLKEEWAGSAERSASFDWYLKLIDQSPQTALMGDERFSRYPHSLGAVFSISLERVKLPESRRALERASFLAPTGIARSWLLAEHGNENGTGDSAAWERRVLSPLFQTALLRREGTGKASIHPLLQEWLQATLSDHAHRAYLTELGTTLAGLARFHAEDLQSWGPFRQLLPHAERVVAGMKRAAVVTEARRDLSFEMGSYWSSMGTFQQALRCFQDARAVVEALEVGETASLALCLDSEANALAGLGDHRKAINLLNRALDIYKTVLGPTHPDVAMALNDLASCHADMGDHGKAIELHQQALRLRKTVFGPRHPTVATSLNNLAITYAHLGDHRRAMDLYEWALHIREAAFGPDHPYVAMSLNNLASCHAALGDHRRAIELQLQALHVYEAVFGAVHPTVAMALNNLAKSYAAFGDHRKAIELHQRALQIRENIFGPDHPVVAASLNDVANRFADLEEHRETVERYERALHIYETAFGSNHPTVAVALNNLGGAWAMLGKVAETTASFERALAIFAHNLGTRHPAYSQCLAEYAWATWVLGDSEEGLARLSGARDALAGHFGPHHPLVGQFTAKLSMIYEAKGDRTTAILEQQKAVDAFLNSLGSDAPRTQEALSRLDQLRAAL